MSSLWIKNLMRIIVLILLQVLLFKRINFGWESFNYFSFILYPVAILLLPVRTPKVPLLFIAFLIGIIVDLFYDSPGVHASASVFLAFIRPYLLKIIEPRGGYPTQDVGPTKRQFGTNWFLIYSAMGLAGHLLIYFSVEVFTFVFFFEILLKVMFSFIVSYICILLYIFLMNPKD